MECNYKIYMHKNKINGKVYIGQTHRELAQRFGSNGAGYIGCPLFYRAIQKYGWDNFEHIVIEENIQSKDDANEKEKYYIKLYNSNNRDFGYNIQSGGYEQNAASICVYKYSLKGLYICSYQSVSEAERCNNIAHGKISECCSGKRKSAGGFMWSYEKYDNIIPYTYSSGRSEVVYNYNFDGDYVGEYPSALYAAKSLGHDSGAHISSCCNGKRQYAYGYQWRKYKVNKIPAITPLNCNEPILKISMDGELINQYENLPKASKEYNNSEAAYYNIYRCLTHRAKSAYGYIWVYKKEYQNFDIDNYQNSNPMVAIEQYTLDNKYLALYRTELDMLAEMLVIFHDVCKVKLIVRMAIFGNTYHSPF